MSPAPIPAQCEGCRSKFSWIRKRRTCLMCRSTYCSSCMQRLRLCGVGRWCLRCVRLAGFRYDRAALQQLTVRDLKHIMKIVDVSSATCREKSDLVDTILMCRESAGQPDSPSAQEPPSPNYTPSAPDPDPAPTAPAASTHRPCRVRPGDSSRVGPHESIRVRAGPYESIRVRAVDDPEPCRPPKQPDVPRASDSSSASLSCEEHEDGMVVVDVEATEDDTDVGEDVAGSIEVEAEAVDTEVETPVNVEVDGSVEVDVAVNVQGDADVSVDVSATARVADNDVESADADGDDADEEDVVVDDDPDEPQSESVAIEVDKKDQDADDPISETDMDLSRLTDVAQIPSEELISRLTVRQCKQLLHHRRTEYRDVIEKEELLRRVRLLWRETKRNSEALASASDRDICKICMDSLVDCVMLECGHMATCTACGKQLAECPICRKYVVRVVHVYRS